MGDEGSGYFLGSEALRAAARAFDERSPHTILTKHVLKEFGLDDPWQLIDAVYTPETTAGRIAKLAIPVVQAARDGDAAATVIVDRAAVCLAELVIATFHKLDMGSQIALSCGGSVLTQTDLLRRRVVAEVESAIAIKLSPVAVVDEPVAGAIVLAQRALS